MESWWREGAFRREGIEVPGWRGRVLMVVAAGQGGGELWEGMVLGYGVKINKLPRESNSMSAREGRRRGESVDGEGRETASGNKARVVVVEMEEKKGRMKS